MLKKHANLFVTFLIIFEICVYLADDMIMPAMINVVKDFSVSESFVPSGLSAFILGGALLPLILGPLSDRHGRRNYILSGVILFVTSCILNGFTNSIGQFLFTRFFQGMGAGFIGVIGYAIVQEKFDEKKAVKITSFMTTISCLVPVIGPFIGSIYISYFHWRTININIGIIALISLIGLYFYFPKDSKSISRNYHSKNFFKEMKDNYIKLFKNKHFMAGTFAYGFIELPFYAWVSIAPIILFEKSKVTNVEYGVYQIPIFGSYVIGLILLQKYVERVSLKKIIIFGSLFSILGLILSFILPFIYGENFLYLILSYSIYTFGAAIISAPLYRIVLFSSSVGLGTVAAIKSSILMIVTAIGTQSMSFVYQNQSNISFGLFGVLMSLLYIIFLSYFFKKRISLNKK